MRKNPRNVETRGNIYFLFHLYITFAPFPEWIAYTAQFDVRIRMQITQKYLNTSCLLRQNVFSSK